MFTTQHIHSAEPSPKERRQHIELQHLHSKIKMLEAENKILLKRISQLVDRLAAETNKDRQLALALEMKILQDRINDQNRDLFGTSSEKRGRPVNSKNDEKKPPRKRKKTGSKRTKQPDLPTATQLHLLDEADQMCPHCGDKLHAKKNKTDSSERIVVTERVYTVVTNNKQVYGCGGCGHSETALAPTQLVPGGRYDTSIAVQIAVDKFADHLPLNRQVTAMKRAGLRISRQSLWDQLNALAKVCEQSYLTLHTWMLSNHILLHADETSWRMMLKGGSARWWLWSLAAEDGFFCMASPTRSTEAARLLLRDFDGTLMSDAYAVYVTLAKQAQQGNFELSDDCPWHPRFIHCICWAHARRPFEKASKYNDEAHVVLDYISELYEIEARAKKLANGDDAKLLTLRAKLRATESQPIIDKIHSWWTKLFVLPGSKMAEGRTFLQNHWVALTHFLKDPAVGLDNNFIERLVRTPVLGRKNHLGSHSERGAYVSAMFYSLIGSCRLVAVSPTLYLTTLAQRVLQDSSYTLLPHEFAAELATKK